MRQQQRPTFASRPASEAIIVPASPPRNGRNGSPQEDASSAPGSPSNTSAQPITLSMMAAAGATVETAAYVHRNRKNSKFRRPKFQVKIAIVTLVLVVVVLLTPALLTGISILSVESVRLEFMAKGQSAVARTAASMLIGQMCPRLLDAVTVTADVVQELVDQAEALEVANAVTETGLTLLQLSVLTSFCRGQSSQEFRSVLTPRALLGMPRVAGAIRGVTSRPPPIEPDGPVRQFSRTTMMDDVYTAGVGAGDIFDGVPTHLSNQDNAVFLVSYNDSTSAALGSLADAAVTPSPSLAATTAVASPAATATKVTTWEDPAIGLSSSTLCAWTPSDAEWLCGADMVASGPTIPGRDRQSWTARCPAGGTLRVLRELNWTSRQAAQHVRCTSDPSFAVQAGPTFSVDTSGATAHPWSNLLTSMLSSFTADDNPQVQAVAGPAPTGEQLGRPSSALFPSNGGCFMSMTVVASSLNTQRNRSKKCASIVSASPVNATSVTTILAASTAAANGGPSTRAPAGGSIFGDVNSSSSLFLPPAASLTGDGGSVGSANYHENPTGAGNTISLIARRPIAVSRPASLDARQLPRKRLVPAAVVVRTDVTAEQLTLATTQFAETFTSRLVLWHLGRRQPLWCVSPKSANDELDSRSLLLGRLTDKAISLQSDEAIACERSINVLDRLAHGGSYEDDEDGSIVIRNVEALLDSAHVLDDLLIGGALVSCGVSAKECPSSQLAVFAFRPRQSYMTQLFAARGRLVAVAFSIGIATVVLMLMLMRSLMHPLRSLAKAIHCCATLRLEAIELMEASAVAEISTIQKSVSYLAIRLFHYARFLPDRVVAQRSKDRTASAGEDDDEGDSAEAALSDSSSSGSSSDEPGTGDDDDDDDQDRHRSDKADQARITGGRGRLGGGGGRRRGEEAAAPVHSICVVATCEHIVSKGILSARVLGSGRIRPSRTSRFMFSYRVTDPVLTLLLRACRVSLNERPGETLLLFVQTPEGKRQLATNEDVLFAIEFFANSGDLAVLHLTVLQGAKKAVFPLLIAANTIVNAALRLVLAGARLADADDRVQLLGLLLLVCLAMQIVQNTLVTAYLLRRFCSLDEEFREWRRVSRREERFAITVGAFNVTNIEVLSCHISIGELRLTAPLTDSLLHKVRKYSFLGFFIGDLIPFIIVAIETILRRAYRDPFVLLSTLASVLSVASILVRHGVIRFVIDAANERSGVRSTQPTSLQLARKDVTVLRLSLADEAHLTTVLPLPVFDELSDAFYAVVAPIIKRFGGLMVHCEGFTHTIYFNAHSVIVDHAHVARVAFDAVAAASRSQFLSKVVFQLRELQKNASGAPGATGSVVLDSATSLNSNQANAIHQTIVDTEKKIFRFRHRPVASIVSGEMCVGYVGTLTAQSFQQVDEMALLATELCRWNTVMGTTLLCNDAAAATIEKNAGDVRAKVFLRRIDYVRYAWQPYGLVCRAESEAGQTDGGGTESGGAVLGDTSPHGFATHVWDVLHVESTPTFYVRSVSRPGGTTLPSSVSGEHGVVDGMEGEFAVIDRPGLEAAAKRDAMKAAASQFNAAMEAMLTMRNPVPLTRYVKQFPHDVTAAKTLRWAAFINADNEIESVAFPRMVTPLGWQLHPCEVDPSLLPRSAAVSSPLMYRGATAASSSSALQESAEAGRRPPRSERRLRATAAVTSMLPSVAVAAQSGDQRISSGAALEKVLGVPNFNLEFGGVVDPSVVMHVDL